MVCEVLCRRCSLDTAPWPGRPAEVDGDQIKTFLEKNQHHTTREGAGRLRESKSMQGLVEMKSAFHFTGKPHGHRGDPTRPGSGPGHSVGGVLPCAAFVGASSLGTASSGSGHVPAGARIPSLSAAEGYFAARTGRIWPALARGGPCGWLPRPAAVAVSVAVRVPGWDGFQFCKRPEGGAAGLPALTPAPHVRAPPLSLGFISESPPSRCAAGRAFLPVAGRWLPQPSSWGLLRLQDAVPCITFDVLADPVWQACLLAVCGPREHRAGPHFCWVELFVTPHPPSLSLVVSFA